MKSSPAEEGFTYAEAQGAVREFLCSTCSGELRIEHVEGFLYQVVCPEHGSVEICGRVTRATVAAEVERERIQFAEVVQNLADLWPELAFPPKRSEQEILKELGY